MKAHIQVDGCKFGALVGEKSDSADNGENWSFASPHPLSVLSGFCTSWLHALGHFDA